MRDDVYKVVEQFIAPAVDTDIRMYGTGRVNDTFLVTVKAQHGAKFILQKISPTVFTHPEWIMENLRVIVDHVLKKLEQEGDIVRWRIPRIYQCFSGIDYYRDDKGFCWRLLEYIDGYAGGASARAGSHEARQAGLALGRFHRMISDLKPERLHDTLPGFHITPLYLAQYDRLVTGKRKKKSEEIRYCSDFISQRREDVNVLVAAEETGKLVSRPIHGDPKLSNILFDEKSGKAISLIDLDTVKPGLIQYDVGDCLRSCCNIGGEEGQVPIHFSLELCREILIGYIEEASVFLTCQDIEFFYAGTRLITFELGLRFFSDYLQGNVYFKTAKPEQNLERALIQFSLVESIERQKKEFEDLISDVVRCWQR